MPAMDLAGIATRSVPPRLRDAWEALESDGLAVVSTDVFDTLVWRRVTDPVDAFPAVGARLRARGLIEPTLGDAAFAELRRVSEEEARTARIAARNQSEVRLAEIYERIPSWVFGTRGEDARADAAEVEVEVEAELVVPDLDVALLLRTAVERGKVLVAVSDTYFSPAQLVRLFAQPGFGGLDFRRLFSSSDYRRNKADGLLGVMASELGVAPERIIHLGDHPVADVEMARRHGMLAVHVERRDSRLSDVIERERRWHVSADPARIVPDLGPTGLTAIRAKVLHRGERDQVPAALRPYWDAGAQVYGPVLAGFAEWVVRWAREHQRTQALCLMREGRFLGELIARHATVEGVNVRCEPFFLNRALLQRASIYTAAPSELEPLFGGRTALSLGQALGLLGLEASMVSEYASDAATSLDERLVRAEILTRLETHAPLRAAVIARSRDVRGRVLAYLRKVVEPGEHPLLLVDLGWGGSIQSLLARLLTQAGVERRVEGLYVVTHGHAARLVHDESLVRGFLCDFGVPHTATAAIMRSPEVIEQVCMPDHGTQLDLTRELEPVLEDIPATLQQLEADVVRQGIRGFQREWHRYTTELPGKLAPLADRDDALRAILARSVADPDATEVLAFGQWSHDENAGSSRVESVVPTDMVGARYMTPGQMRDLPMNDLYWPLGLAAAVDPPLARLTSMAAAGEIDWDLLETGVEGGPARIRISDGDLPLHDEVEQPLRRNRHGLSYLRATLRASAIREVSVRFAQAPCAVRIDSFVTTAWVRGRDEPVRRHVAAAEVMDALRVENAYVEAPNLVVCRNHFPVVSAPVADEVPGQIYRVDVEVALAILPLSVGMPTPGRFADVVQAETAYAELLRAHHELQRNVRDPRWIARRFAARAKKVARGG